MEKLFWLQWQNFGTFYLMINIRSSTSINAFKQNYCNFIKQGYAGLDSWHRQTLFNIQYVYYFFVVCYLFLATFTLFSCFYLF